MARHAAIGQQGLNVSPFLISEIKPATAHQRPQINASMNQIQTGKNPFEKGKGLVDCFEWLNGLFDYGNELVWNCF